MLAGRRTGPRGFGFGLLTGAFALAILLLSLSAGTARSGEDADWHRWGLHFDRALARCVTAKERQCLVKAYRAAPRPSLEPGRTDVADMLYRDLRTAEVMLHNTEAVSLLKSTFGVDSTDYLGTGYSVPLTGPGAHAYEAATQREFFVPNLCADTADAKICPARAPGLWLWRIPAADLAAWADKPLDALANGVAPASDSEGFAAAESAHSEGPMPALLVRFSSFPAKYDTGLVGRQGAARVFFASYDQVRGKTLREVLIGTGSTGLLDAPNPANTFFMWIYMPQTGGEAAPASWHALFQVLEAEK